MAHRVGIDLGTTNSAIAFTELGRQRCEKVDKNEYRSAVFPSAIALDKNGNPLYGGKARRALACIREFKRGIGTDRKWTLGDQELGSVELSALLLAEIRKKFEESVGPIEGAVITVPANFTDQKRAETQEAGRLAGLNVLRIINEPSAAAIAYSLSDSPPDRDAIVIDWGGGTLDVSLLDHEQGFLDVKANDGDEYCGGGDLDRAVFDLVVQKAGADLGDAKDDPAVRGELLLLAEKIKIHLSEEDEWDEPIVTRSRPLFIDFSLTRQEYDRAIRPIVDRVMAAIERCLEKAPEGARSPSDITDVILVGGSCHIPQLKDRVEKFFGRAGRMDIDPMEVVALGAAYQAEHAHEAGRLVVVHSLAHSLGVSCMGMDPQNILRENLFEPILTSGTKLPAEGTDSFWTVHDGQDAIQVEVYEALIENSICDGMTLWDNRSIPIPPAPARSYSIDVTFKYSLDQVLTVVVEIPEKGIREEWVSEGRRKLEQGREGTQKTIDDLRFRSLDALKQYRERVVQALGHRASDPEIRDLLKDLDRAIESGDLDEAKRAKRKLGGALFEANVSLS